MSLNLCSAQEDQHRCGAALSDGVPDAPTDVLLFNRYARAGVPWVARNASATGAPRSTDAWVSAIGKNTPVRALQLPEGVYGVGYLGEARRWEPKGAVPSRRANILSTLWRNSRPACPFGDMLVAAPPRGATWIFRGQVDGGSVPATGPRGGGPQTQRRRPTAAVAQAN